MDKLREKLKSVKNVINYNTREIKEEIDELFDMCEDKIYELEEKIEELEQKISELENEIENRKEQKGGLMNIDKIRDYLAKKIDEAGKWMNREEDIYKLKKMRRLLGKIDRVIDKRVEEYFKKQRKIKKQVNLRCVRTCEFCRHSDFSGHYTCTKHGWLIEEYYVCNDFAVHKNCKDYFKKGKLWK